MATRDSLIRVTDLKKYYNMGAIKALDGVTVDIHEGDVMAVIGCEGRRGRLRLGETDFPGMP